MDGLIVLGMHRSGTSALTGTLQQLGFDAGKALMPPDAFNKKGYFEDACVVEGNEALLRRLGRSWSDARLLPQRWSRHQWLADVRREFAGILRAEYDLSRPWVMKDPRLCRVLPLWQQVFSDLSLQPGYVLSVRHPLAVAGSLKRRDEMPSQWALALYALHLLEAERQTRGSRRAVVSYARLLNDWQAEMTHTFQSLGTTLPKVSGEWVAQALGKFLDPGMTHGEEPAEPLEAGTAQAWTPAWIACQTHELLLRTQPFSEPELFDELWQQLCSFLGQIEPWASEAAAARLQRDEAGEQRDRMLQFLRAAGTQQDHYVNELYGRHALSVVYWRGALDDEYAEARTVQQSLVFQAEQTLRFVLPTQCPPGLTALRWDITDRPAACEVRDAWVEDPAGRRVWQWQELTSLLKRSSPDLTLVDPKGSHRGFPVFVSGQDPFAELVLPEDVLRMMGPGWAFVVVTWVALPTAALRWVRSAGPQVGASAVGEPPGTPGISADSPGSTEKETQAPGLSLQLEEVGRSMRSVLSRRDQTIAQQRRQLELAHLDLARAEAQLDLLKTLFQKTEGPPTVTQRAVGSPGLLPK